MKKASVVLLGVLVAGVVASSAEAQQPQPAFQLPTALPTALPTLTMPTALPSVPSPAALLAPLIGSAAMQAEIRKVLDDLIGHLSTTYASRVRGMPLKFDPDVTEINAYAGCDQQGKPFLAATDGLLQAMLAIATTRACDEIAQVVPSAYDAYMKAVLPVLQAQKPGSPALPANVVPSQCMIDLRVLSHAHELFDDITAFTFGHELAHHYMGHTGCAINDSPFTQGMAAVEHLSQQLVPAINQPNEIVADNVGLYNVMDTGRAHRPNYEYTEKGGLLLLDFFAKLEGAGSGLTAFSRSHPPSTTRESWVKTAAIAWRLQHP